MIPLLLGHLKVTFTPEGNLANIAFKIDWITQFTIGIQPNFRSIGQLYMGRTTGLCTNGIVDRL
ncbi:hypothetical protein D3C81_1138400 [compost metagenome]